VTLPAQHRGQGTAAGHIAIDQQHAFSLH
jgi:hypothetical protein